MALVSNPKPGDDVSVRQAIARLGSSKLGPKSSPKFLAVNTTSLTISGLTTNSLIYPVSGLFTSLGVASDGQLPIGSTGAAPVLAEITGTANQITSTPGAGSITLSTPQDIHTGAIPTFAGALLSGTTAIGLDMSGGTFATAAINAGSGDIITTGLSTAATFNATDENNVLQVDGTTIFRPGNNANKNIFIGDNAFSNDDGNDNIGIGFEAGKNNDASGGKGKRNIYIGTQAGEGSTTATNNTGQQNVVIGWHALRRNTTGASNFALGQNALLNNNDGDANVAIGINALIANISGKNNVAIGNSALDAGNNSDNVAIGFDALTNCLASGSVAIGKGTLFNVTTGPANVGIGSKVGYFNTTGERNVYIGFAAGGIGGGGGNHSYNTFIGANSGHDIGTGSFNVFIGNESGHRQTTNSNLLIIDNRVRGSASAEMTDVLIYGIFNNTSASQILRVNVGNFIQGNPVHSDADGGGAMVHSWIREDGAGTPSTAATLTVSHDGSGANDQLAKMVFGVNTGAGVVDVLKIDSSAGVSIMDGASLRYTFPTADGLSGSVITTNGSGILSFTSNASEKAWAFMSRDASSGTNYVGGFYKFETSANDFNPGVNFGTANVSYAAHFFFVQAAGASGGTDTVIRVSGTTIDDQGNRATVVNVDIAVDDAGAAGTYYETTEKWLGQVTITKQSGPDLLCNYGFCKYWDNNNTDFKVAGIEATWLGAKNDATPNIQLRHHKSTGWTYNMGAAPTPPSAIVSMATDHNTEIEIATAQEGAWKRDNLSTNIMGSGNEGTIIELTTTTNHTYAIGNFMIRITPQ